MREEGWLRSRGRGALAEHRDRVTLGVAICVAAVLLPFAINNLAQGRTALGLVTSTVCALLGGIAYAIYRGRSPKLLTILLFLAAIGGLAMSIRTQGLAGIFWAYPGVLMFHFMLERRIANLLNAGMVAVVVPLSYLTIGGLLTIRVAATLGLIILIANIFSLVVSELQIRLQAQATQDPLTGAHNRRQLDPSLDDAIERERRYGTAASLLAVDIDHFKDINDQHGHGQGDAVLRGAVSAMQGRLRRLDLLFRSGGDEFVVLLPDTRLPEALKLAEALREAIAGASLLPDRPVTVSVGAAELRRGEDREAWLRRCDQALYRAKAADRNRVST